MTLTAAGKGDDTCGIRLRCCGCWWISRGCWARGDLPRGLLGGMGGSLSNWGELEHKSDTPLSLEWLVAGIAQLGVAKCPCRHRWSWWWSWPLLRLTATLAVILGSGFCPTNPMVDLLHLLLPRIPERWIFGTNSIVLRNASDRWTGHNIQWFVHRHWRWIPVSPNMVSTRVVATTISSSESSICRRTKQLH